MRTEASLQLDSAVRSLTMFNPLLSSPASCLRTIQHYPLNSKEISSQPAGSATGLLVTVAKDGLDSGGEHFPKCLSFTFII